MAPLDAQQVLQKYFRLSHFRPGQMEAISSVLRARDTLAVMPTGGGKSLCYQIPAFLLPGVTIVISPLIALMKDQVDALQKLGLPATFLNSTLSQSEAEQRIYATRQGQYKLLYIAPERFRAASFMKLIHTIQVSLLAVDEAHCVSQWGHDFRPSYLKIAAIRKEIGNPPLMALTATATRRVQQDIINQLQMNECEILVKGFDRENLVFFAVELQKDVQKKREVVRIVESVKGSAIVYVATQKAVEEVRDLLAEAGIESCGYHGGMDKATREESQNRWLAGSAPVIVATNAFGMGIDKQDVRLVLHYNLPASVEAYYQEAGRAGRDGRRSFCVLLFNYRDRMIQEFLIENSFPPQEVLRAIYEFLFSLNRKQILMTYQEIATAANCTTMQVSSAVKLFEQVEILKRMRKTDADFRFTLLKSHDKVESEVKRARQLRLLYGWLRDHQLDMPTQQEALDALDMSVEQFNYAMSGLVQRGIVDYEPPFRGRGIELTSTYQRWNRVPIDFTALKKRQQQQLDRLQEIEDYLTGDTCRRRYLLAYFGEEYHKSNCNACDVCLNWKSPELKNKHKRGNKMLAGILEAVFDLDGVFGVKTIAGLLKGLDDERFEQRGLDMKPYYATLVHKSEKEIMAAIFQAIKKGYLKRSDGRYPVLEITEKGISRLQT